LTFNDQRSWEFWVYNNNQSEKILSFNYNRSNLTNTNPDVADDYKEIETSVDSIFDTNRQSDNQIWKWFLFLTLLFITLEVLIQNL
jgi:hypothetical protein